jgi:hypothetical protein
MHAHGEPSHRGSKACTEGEDARRKDEKIKILGSKLNCASAENRVALSRPVFDSPM